MASYCENRDVYTYGLGPDALAASRLRAVEAVDASAGVLRINGAGLFDGDPLTFVVQGSPILNEEQPALPLGLSESIAYEAVPVNGSSSLFRVRPVGGATIVAFGDAGVPVFSIAQDPRTVLDALRADESSQVDDALTANTPPIDPDPITGLYPQLLVGVVARRVAIRAALRFGLSNPGYQASLDRLLAGQALDNARLDMWIKGRPINVRPPDQSATPANAARAGNDATPVAWRTGTL